VKSLPQLRLSTSWGELVLAGGSRAGEGTVLLLPQLRLALDLGRTHRATPPMTTALVSHGHTDHIAGLAYWASQRMLNSMGHAVLIAPREIAPDLTDLLTLHARLEGGSDYDVEIVAAAHGDTHRLRRDMTLELYRTDHWVPTIGARLVWTRHRLRRDLEGSDPHLLAELRRRGECVTRAVPTALLAYGADTGPGLFDRPAALDAEVVLLECSFWREGDVERARRYGHLHVNDLLSALGSLRCRHLVLLHASRRHRIKEIESLIEAEIAPRTDARLHHLITDWD
jgi:ribonuclease Z